MSGVQLALALLVTLLGLAAFDVQLVPLWNDWMHSGLHSVGLLVVPVSAWLAFRAWRWSDWASGGTWWGMAPIVAALFAGKMQFLLSLTGGLNLNLLPIGAKISLYLMGVVLLFGGVAAWRRALFPLLLVILINPCPAFVPVLLDLPLQRAGAHVARAFAHLLGVPLNGDLLHLMFSPDQGVFIAPGCDGLRGSITLGFAALVAGYLYRLRMAAHAAYVLAAVLLAYLLNFVRLCVVVAYTALAFHVSPVWFGHGETFDYLAGGSMFLLTAFLFLNWPRRHPELCTPRS